MLDYKYKTVSVLLAIRCPRLLHAPSHAKPHSNEPQLSSLDFTSSICRGDGSSIETEDCLQERAVPGGARALEFEERMPHAIKNGLECIRDQRCANSNFSSYRNPEFPSIYL